MDLRGQAGWVKPHFAITFLTLASEALKSSFDAARYHGFILVFIRARDFAETDSSDKFDLAWAVNAVRSALSSNGLSVRNENFVKAFLDSGIRRCC